MEGSGGEGGIDGGDVKENECPLTEEGVEGGSALKNFTYPM